MTTAESPAESIFFAALAKKSAQERAEYIVQACQGDAALRSRVERLLKALPQIGEFLQPDQKRKEASSPQELMERIGSFVGPYKLLQQIGEGGMGTVWMAEQLQPVQRKVALKLIKPGMNGAQVIARFEAERQALAMMDHVNIARVLDAGTSQSGLPYFVMELVHGVPITKYCDDNLLSPRQRLELFLPVCHAIQHAHQKGIIHRDIKPSNIMITHYDGKPVPKIIDFGVAKATERRLTERTLFTQYGMMVGTLEYMSPEQAEMSALGVDTRSDIYSLGVLLYELLTGSTPLSHQRLKDAAFAEILRMIKEEEPPKPSTRLSDSGESLASISARRHMEPEQLTKLVRGELDWIVMKSLEKERNRRYESAGAFAADVQRYLSDETVTACPPSRWYRFRKFARRKKGLLAAISLIMVSLIAGIFGTTWAMIEARAQFRKASDGETQALKSEAQTKAVLEFFEKRIMAAARPKGQGRGLGRDATIRDAVDKAEPDISKAFLDQPVAESSIRRVLGLTYWYMGEYAKAVAQHEQALALREAHLGADHPDTFNSMTNLGQAYQSAGRLNDALRLIERSLQLRIARFGPDHSETLWTMNRLAETLTALGRYSEALPLLQEELQRSKASLGLDHSDTLIYMDKLAVGYLNLDRQAEAIPLFEETFKLYQAKLAPDHPDRLANMSNLGKAYLESGRWTKAEALYKECNELKNAVLGPDHPESLISRHNLALVYRDAGQPAKALPMLEEVVRLHTAKLGADHHITLGIAGNLATVYRDLGRYNEALQWFQDTLRRQLVKLSADHPRRLLVLNHTGDCLIRMKKYDEAETLLRDCLALHTQREPSGWWVGHTKSQLGQALAGLKRHAEAESLLLEANQELTLRKDAIPSRFLFCRSEAANCMADLYTAWGKKELAVPWRNKFQELQKELQIRKAEMNK